MPITRPLNSAPDEDKAAYFARYPKAAPYPTPKEKVTRGKWKRPKPKSQKVGYRSKVKVLRRGSRSLIDPALIIAACENATGVSHIITSSPGIATRDIGIARSIEWYCLYKYSGITQRKLAVMYGRHATCIGEAIHRLHRYVNPDNLWFDEGKKNLLEEAAFVARMLRSSKKIKS
jgi:hypothetical protein